MPFQNDREVEVNDTVVVLLIFIALMWAFCLWCRFTKAYHWSWVPMFATCAAIGVSVLIMELSKPSKSIAEISTGPTNSPPEDRPLRSIHGIDSGGNQVRDGIHLTKRDLETMLAKEVPGRLQRSGENYYWSYVSTNGWTNELANWMALTNGASFGVTVSTQVLRGASNWVSSNVSIGLGSNN